MEIELEYKLLWGAHRFYPLNEEARTLCEIAVTKSLSKRQVMLCKKMGWKVTVKMNDKIEDLLK